MTYVNIKNHKKSRFQPHFQIHMFEETPAVLGLTHNF